MRKLLSFAVLAAATGLLSSTAWLFAKEKVFSAPRAFHAKTFPAHETHEDEKLSVAADPYDMPDKAARVFTVDYKYRDVLPIFMIFSNDGDQPISLASMAVTLVTKKRVEIAPYGADDLYRRISRQTSRGDEGNRPFPFPKRKHTVLSKEAKDEVQDAQFMAKAVEPHATQAGFMFFDVSGIENPLAGAKLEITGLADAKGHELFYFEIPLEKYLNYQPVK